MTRFSFLLPLLWTALSIGGTGCGFINGTDASLDDSQSARWGDDDDDDSDSDELTLVSLGASTSFGVTFDPGLLGAPDDAVIADNAHIPRLVRVAARAYDVDREDVVALNLSVPGATSGQVRRDQLPAALEAIRNAEGRVVVTIEGGGNDLRQFQVESIDLCLDPSPASQQQCVQKLGATLFQINSNLAVIADEILRVAPRARLIFQTQYNSTYDVLPNGAPCASPELQQIADFAFEANQANGDPIQGLNTLIRQLAQSRGAGVADIAGYLYSSGHVTNPDFYGGDCTHLQGERPALPAFGLAADRSGIGYEALFRSYAAAF